MTPAECNRLCKEASLYLRQHAENPVHWQPWDERALAAARESGRPILLSIGYSACHWCHVMAHESFEDAATAEDMNRLFVNVKVDREERPDLDRIYQLAHQLLTGRGGGWPLTVFLDPSDLVPFFAGTYFPRERRYGMPAFREVLQAIDTWYRENRDEVRGQNAKLADALRQIQGGGEARAPGAQNTPALLGQAEALALSRYDAVHGGFGGAPRFPQAPLLEALAALSAERPQGELGRALAATLRKMARSGLRDHLDGGFFRYCVDATWTIPHFEKMLYDNAMLLPLYAEAAQMQGEEDLRRAAEGIADWLQVSMRQHTGGYAASIDADAGGEEGAFHVWTPSEVDDLLDEASAALFKRAYGLDGGPNFENRAWHLLRSADAAELAAGSGLEPGVVESMLDSARQRLREAREERVHPTLDHKQLAGWNALLAAGFVRAGRALQRNDWIDRAEEIVTFLRRDWWDGERLLAVFNDGEARFAAYLDDYAWLLGSLLELLSVRWRREWLDFAIELAEALLARFEDGGGGAFWFSDAEVEVPIARSMIFQDDATPAGNGSAALALNRLAHLLGEPRYADAAERCLRRGRARVEESPLGHASMLLALLEAERPPPQLVIMGRDPLQTAAWLERAAGVPRLRCYSIGESAEGLPGLLGEFRPEAAASAWLCKGMHCLPPAHDASAFEALLEAAHD